MNTVLDLLLLLQVKLQFSVFRLFSTAEVSVERASVLPKFLHALMAVSEQKLLSLALQLLDEHLTRFIAVVSLWLH